MSRQRAQITAARRAPRQRGELKSLVRFEIGDTCYAFDVANVEEVVQPVETTALAHMAGDVAGVYDHRGRVTPIVDLRARFATGRASNRTTKWILMRTEHGLVGFVVDRVLDVVGTAEQLNAPPEVGPGADVRALRAVTTIQERLVFLLDESKLAALVRGLDLSPG